MHTIHYNKEVDHEKHGHPDAALSMFFSVKEHNAKLTPDQVAIIDNFFDSLLFSTVITDGSV